MTTVVEVIFSIEFWNPVKVWWSPFGRKLEMIKIWGEKRQAADFNTRCFYKKTKTRWLSVSRANGQVNLSNVTSQHTGCLVSMMTEFMQESRNRNGLQWQGNRVLDSPLSQKGSWVNGAGNWRRQPLEQSGSHLTMVLIEIRHRVAWFSCQRQFNHS